MNVMEAVLASGWTALGAAVLTAAALNGVTKLVQALKGTRSVTVTTYGDKTRIVKIENADAGDVREAVTVYVMDEREDDLEAWK